MANDSGLKQSIRDIPVANERLYDEVGRLLKMDTSEVRDIVQFAGRYAANVIEQGFMEDVMFPYFGKIKVKATKLERINAHKANKANGLNAIQKGLSGFTLKLPEIPEPKELEDETIRDRSRLHASAEQGMDHDDSGVRGDNQAG